MMNLRDEVIKHLVEAGFDARPARPWVTPRPVEACTILVAVSRMEAVQGAMYRYLGLDEEDRELYGMALTAEIKLSLLSPKAQGGEGGEQFAEQVAAALLRGIQGMPLRNVLWGETGYDPVRDSFVTELRLTAGVMARALKEEEMIRLERFEFRPNYE